MITLSSARRRADEFAAAVDAPTGTTTRPELVELVDVVATLRAHASDTRAEIAPRVEFTAGLRGRLLAEAAETWTYDPAATRLELPARPTARRERRLVVAATALVLAGGSAGMATAAQQSLPGETLYPVKRGLEAVRADLTSGDAAKGRTLLEQADGRLDEIRALLADSAIDPAVASTLKTYRAQAEEGSALLLRSYEAEADEAAVRDVRGFALSGLSELEAIASEAPEDLQDDLQVVVTALEAIETRASDLCPTCIPSRALTLPVAFRPALDDAARVLASLDGATLNNDHPLVSPRIAPPITLRADPDASALASPAPGSEDGADALPDALPEAPSTGTGTPGDVTDGLPDGLPGLGGKDDATPDAGELVDTARDGAEQVEKTVTDAVRDLEDAVEDGANPLEDGRLPN